jgi:hypothetical protein
MGSEQQAPKAQAARRKLRSYAEAGQRVVCGPRQVGLFRLALILIVGKAPPLSPSSLGLRKDTRRSLM